MTNVFHTLGRRLAGIDWSARGRAQVYLWTFITTLACIVIVTVVDWSTLPTSTGYEFVRARVLDVLMPITLYAPMVFLLLGKIRQLAIVQEQLSVFASTDSLTTLLNRGAFIDYVESVLAPSRRRDAVTRGALLVIDADHFKLINDRFGHDQGDTALRLIADGIRAALRANDVVGRIGGEEFGVFLPGADPHEAEHVAERIRKMVACMDFRVAGKRHRVTVSIGGALFSGPVPFGELYRLADRRLYAAKDAGRNRIDLAPAARRHVAAAA